MKCPMCKELMFIEPININITRKGVTIPIYLRSHIPSKQKVSFCTGCNYAESYGKNKIKLPFD